MTPPTAFVRRNIYDFTDPNPFLDSLRKGVSTMQGRDENDPTSWLYQANMHGTYDDPQNQNEQDFWNGCQHASYFFLSWHRMYIYYLERILRQASGDPNFALPYWNYSDVDEQRALPPSFRTPTIPGTDTPNSLYVAQRAAGINGGYKLPRSNVDYANAYQIIPFTNSSGQDASLTFGGGTIAQPEHFSQYTGGLENVPHNAVHNDVGGPNGWMADPNLAARDPIFYLHHSNIDRLWEGWLALGQGRVNPTDDQTWMTTQYSFFDENGNPVTMTGADILDTAGQLGYTYEGLTTPAVAPGPAEIQPIAAESAPIRLSLTGQSTTGTVSLGAEPTDVPVALVSSPTAHQEIQALAANAAPPANRLVLSLEGVDYDRIPDANYEVYLNLPEGVKPDPASDYYVGNLGFFGLGPNAHGSQSGRRVKGNVVLDITDVVRKLQAAGKWQPGQAKVTLVPTKLEPPPGLPEIVHAPGERARIDRIRIAPQ